MRGLNKRFLKWSHLTVSALIATTIVLPAMADDDYFDNARVISATPQTERVNMPRQDCSTEYVRESYGGNYGYQEDRSPAGAIIGGIAGGLLGGTVGRGSGRVAAAAVGAGVGAVVGDRMSNNNQGYGSRTMDRPVQRCVSVDNWQTVNRGYLVQYRYNGRNYTTVSDAPPGDTIRVRVMVATDNGQAPAAYSAPAGYYDAPPPLVSPIIYGEGRRYDGYRGRRHDRDYW
jgi:uncharacterized protein YcfJ